MITRVPKKQIREYIEQSGGAKRIHEQLQDYASRVMLLDSKRKALTKKHPDKWVAMNHNEIVAICDSLEEVLAAIDQKGIPREEAVIQFLDSQPTCMIL